MSEDPIVTLLDGTKMPKSKVPVDTAYVNEKGVKVKKVVTKLTQVSATPSKTSVATFLKSGAGAAILSLAIPKLKQILKDKDLDGLSMLLNDGTGNNNFQVDSIISFVSSIANGNIDKQQYITLIQSIDIQQILNLANSLNLPWLNKVCDILTKIVPANTPIQQFNNYLDLALEDDRITEGEKQRIFQLGKQAGLTETQIEKALVSR